MSPIAITRQSSILFFGREGSLNPVASVQVAIMGECAFLYSLMGPGFYEHLAEHGLAEFEKLGLHYVYAAVSDAHLRLMRRKLKLVQVVYLFKNQIAGHLLNWVLITTKAPESENPRRPEGGTLRKYDMSASDSAIEAEIQAKGLTAPRVTPARIEEVIATEHYFTGWDGALSAGSTGTRHHEFGDDTQKQALDTLTFCVLVLRNGFTVTGESACASPENFDAAIGRKIARANAVQKIWPLEGYALKSQLAVAA